MPGFFPGILAGTTGFEPAISGLTGQHVNHYTTPPGRITVYHREEILVKKLYSIFNYTIVPSDPAKNSISFIRYKINHTFFRIFFGLITNQRKMRITKFPS
jgi:hypothetical protein